MLAGWALLVLIPNLLRILVTTRVDWLVDIRDLRNVSKNYFICNFPLFGSTSIRRKEEYCELIIICRVY